MDHDRLAALAMRFARSGMAAGAVFNFLRTALSNLPGIDEERRQRRLRELRGIVDSAVGKIEAESRPAATPAPLGQVVAVFHECLALKDDDPIYVTLGTVAANLLPSRDPTWLGLIGPPSAAKTELLNSLSRLPYVHTVETFTGPGLLSGTPKKEKTAGATGGVLRKIGAFGIMLFKDFGSVIELRHEQRGEMMAALRRIYDGQYTRTLGTEGGRTYTWTGRAGLLFGATQAYDSHHAVGGTLGDRFLLFRVASMPKEQLEKCHLRPGAPTDMRARLAAAVAGLFASLPDPPPEPERMTDDEYAGLSKAISTVIKLRGGVMRDRIHRDIEDVLDPEGPARLALALQQLFAGLCFIGVDRAKGAALVEQVAYDSAPKLRLRALRALTDQWQTTRDVANAIKLPTTSTKHALEELMVQGLALRDEAGEQQDKDDLFDKGTKGRSGVHRWKLPPLNPQYTSHGYIEPEILLEEFVG